MSVTLKLKPTCENTYLWSKPAGSSPKRPSKRLPQASFTPGGHQQSRPHSRSEPIARSQVGSSATTAPPSPVVMWWAG